MYHQNFQHCSKYYNIQPSSSYRNNDSDIELYSRHFFHTDTKCLDNNIIICILYSNGMCIVNTEDN